MTLQKTLQKTLQTMLSAAFFLVPVVLISQTPPAEVPKPVEPPAEVDQALHARVSEFLQYHVDGNYRKAFEMVAEDSKDYYFGMAKPKYLGYELTDITYTDNFTKATVTGKVKQMITFAGRAVEMPIPASDSWELENGKWMWMHKKDSTLQTPFGTVTLDPSAKVASNDLPKDLSPEAAIEAAKKLDVKIGVNKKALAFTLGKAGSDEFVFHNGLNGFVNVLATPIFDGGTLKAEPSEMSIPAGKDVTFVIHYDPAGGKPINPPVVRLTIEPFSQSYFLPVHFAKVGE